MKKRLSALMLCLILIFVQSVGVLAKGDDTESPVNESISVTTETFINPLYDDIIDESDLKKPDDSDHGISAFSSVKYHTSIEEAGKEMREHLKAREESFTVGYQAAAYESSFSRNISKQAMIHTGNPTEGDYLQWQYAGWYASISYYTQNGVCYMAFNYIFTYYTTSEQETEVDRAVQALLAELNLDGQSDYAKIKSIYDYICENVTYDYDNLNNTDYKLQYTAYGALVNGTSVCQGYSVLFYRLALEEGVDARLIVGQGNGGGHAWNIVQIRGLYYNLDSTWDAGRSVYSYFLKCEDNFLNHTRDLDYDTDEFNLQYPMGTKDYVVQEEDLPVEIAFEIIANPQDYTGKLGEIASFTVEATGKDLEYQWQYCNAGTAVWKISGQSGNKTDTLYVPITEARNGQKYRCIVTDYKGESVTSGEAVIYLEREEKLLEITEQPADYTGAAGDMAVFAICADGNDIAYQWQYCNAGTTVWKTSGQTGNKTAELHVPITEARNGQKYRCVVTDGTGNQVVSNEAVLYVGTEIDKLTITAQPEDYAGEAGETAVFTVIANGNGLIYQWEYQNKGSNIWKASGQTGNKTAELRVPITDARNGQKYRCVVTDEAGNQVISDAAVLYLGTKLNKVTIISQPIDYTGTAGETAIFSVIADGDALTYQWEYQNMGSDVWRASGQTGNKTAELRVPITDARNGQKYRCVVTDIYGNSEISETAVIRVQ